MTCSSLPVSGAGASLSIPSLATPFSGALQRRTRPVAAAGGRGVSSVRRRGGSTVSAAPATPLLLVLVLCGVALLVAPEQPQAQEAICQRHNGVAACRVW